MPREVAISEGLCQNSRAFWPHRRPEHVGNHSWHDEVDLSRCFQETAVLYTICVIFWVLAAMRFCCYVNQPRLPYSWLNVTKIVLCTVIVITGLCDLVKTVMDVINDSSEVPNYQIISPIVLLLSAVVMIAVILSEKNQGIPSSGIQFSFWGTLIIYAGIKLRTLILLRKDQGHVAKLYYFVTSEVNFAVFLVQFILSLFQDKQSAYQYTEEDDNPNPELSASFLSQLTWWWQNGMIVAGWRRALEISDLWSLNPRYKSQSVAPQLAKAWQRELDKSGASEVYEEIDAYPPGFLQSRILSGHLQSQFTSAHVIRQAPKNPSLYLALIKTLGLSFLVTGLLKFISDLLIFLGPLVLKWFIQYTKDEDEPMWKGYFYAVLLFVSAIIQSLVLQHYFHRCFVADMHLRTAIISIVYNKLLRLSNSARQQITVEDIVNLMSLDARRLANLANTLHLIWSNLLQIALSIMFLYFAIGLSALAGVIKLGLLRPLNTLATLGINKLQAKKMKYKNRRIQLMNEVLNGIKVIKLYAWEDHFQSDMQKIRRKELVISTIIIILDSILSFTNTCAPYLAALVAFGTFVSSSSEPLTPERAFVVIMLFTILHYRCSILPFLGSNEKSAGVSVKKLSAFLQLEEIDPDNLETREQPASGSEDAVTVQTGTFYWAGNSNFALENINLSIKAGQLVVVVGHVGAGKSSLISALLGEMKKIRGHVLIKGHVAYVPQQAWIQNATVQDNILFGKAHNTALYDSVIDCCALGPELESLPERDLTKIGEKGINLSSGQKQRVSLARAVYQEADVYYFDDPLSAIDSHVGKHIFDKVIGPEGLLKEKTRVFVTHNLSCLPQCDVIIMIENGVMCGIGAYAELIYNNRTFAEFVHTTCASEKMFEETSETLKSSQFIREEMAESRNVKLSIVWEYIKSCTFSIGFLTLLFYIGYNGCSVGANVLLAKWSSDEDKGSGNMSLTSDQYLGIYAAFGFGQSILVFLASFFATLGGIIASRLIYNRLLISILRLPMSFFDTTPSSRIFNRFSEDIHTIDEIIPCSVRAFIAAFFTILSIISVISYVTPLFIFVILPLLFFYLLILRFYVVTSCQLKRFESVRQSLVSTHFQETLYGVSSIRAYGQQDRFIMESEQKVDAYLMAYYPKICAHRWLAVQVEFVGSLVILFATLFAVIKRNHDSGGLDPGLAGLSITYALQITQVLNSMVRISSELEANMVAVERTKEYAEALNEAPAIIYEHRPPHDWPSIGRVQFEHYSTRYREGLDLVLKEITCDINGGEKVGIVGRTEAGKSSMTLGLFRIIEAAGGSIIIDDHNIALFGLQDLRSRITIIPQDPVLFADTLRANLDPFDKYTDNEVWKCLESAHLKDYVVSLEDTLNHQITESGKNLSVGQRRLVCLGRALLRKTKILVLDEVTAAVDMETDDLIQQTIRTEFADCTVITIAHRLNTIMNYDRIIVLEAGRIAELGSPQDLLERKGVFHGMAQDAGIV